MALGPLGMTIIGSMEQWLVELDELCGMVDAVERDALAATSDGGGGSGSADVALDGVRLVSAGVSAIGGGGVKDAIQRACRVANAIASMQGGDLPPVKQRKRPQKQQQKQQQQQRPGMDDEEHADCGAVGARTHLDECRARVHRVLSSLYYIDQVLSASSAAWRHISSAPDEIDDDDLAAGIARFSIMETQTDVNRIQQLILFLLNTAQLKGYRRRHGQLYRRVGMSASDAGMASRPDTHAWERLCDMRDFVYESTRKEVQFDMWMNLTCVRTNMGAVVDHLTSCHDVQLPDLHPDRHVFSFANGIYFAKDDRFVAYGTPEHAALPESLVAAKYFDQPFPADDVALGQADDEEQDWYRTIDTPHVQGILDFQDMSEEVCRWMYALMGRMLYEVGEMDAWQVIPFLKGAASSGKSTLLVHACRNFYEHDDVGTLSNNIERKFGLSALHDKLMFIGPEIKGDIQLEQAEFQSIVSGETVQIATKYRTAQSVQWRVPGALAGNEVPGWVDKAGSINRRIVLFDFPKRVKDGDMELGRKIERSLPALLLKCNRAYLQAVRRHARANIWNHLPEPFHAAKDDLSESCNSIVHFLRSGVLEFGRACYMPFQSFAAAYEAYVHEMGLSKLRLTNENVVPPLMAVSCFVAKDQTKLYPRADSNGSSSSSSNRSMLQKGRFVVGCDIAARQTVPIDPEPFF